MPKTFEFVPEDEYRPVMSAVCSAVEKVKRLSGQRKEYRLTGDS